MAQPIKVKTDNLIIGDVKESKITGDLKNIYYILNNMYRDPIASIVRELTSNALDATIASKNDEPVIVKLINNEFSVQDFGIGMDKEFAENHYFDYLNSSKHEDNEQIGMWGLGAKSVLAYAEIITVITIKDGWRYEYRQFLNEDGIPTYTLISETEVEDRNGTTIIFPLKNSWSDKRDFHNEMLNLVFNKNVYLISDYEIINNEAAIYDFKTFKLEKQKPSTYSSRNEYDGQPFILLNDIKYNILYDKLKIIDYIGVRIGIKFSIGELQPTPTRDDIYYNKKSIKIIQNRIKEVEQELLEIYNEQYPPQCTNFEEMFKSLNSTSKKIQIDEEVVINPTILQDNNILNITYPEYPDVKINKYNKLLFYNIVDRDISAGNAWIRGYDRKINVSKLSKTRFVLNNKDKGNIDTNNYLRTNYKDYHLLFYYKKDFTKKTSYKLLRQLYKDTTIDKLTAKEQKVQFIEFLKEKEQSFIKSRYVGDYQSLYEIHGKKVKTQKKIGIKPTANVYILGYSEIGYKKVTAYARKYKDYTISNNTIIGSLMHKDNFKMYYRLFNSKGFPYKFKFILLNNKDLLNLDTSHLTNVFTVTNNDNLLKTIIDNKVLYDYCAMYKDAYNYKLLDKLKDNVYNLLHDSLDYRSDKLLFTEFIISNTNELSYVQKDLFISYLYHQYEMERPIDYDINDLFTSDISQTFDKIIEYLKQFIHLYYIWGRDNKHPNILDELKNKLNIKYLT